MNIKEELENCLLVYCLQDWEDISSIDGWARLLGVHDINERKALVLSVISDLQDRGLIAVGDLSGPNGFRAWDRQLAAERMAKQYTEHIGGDVVMADVWLANTPEGDRRAKTLPHPTWASDDDD